MSVITLTTDFGIQDEYAGIMKGVILSIDPSAVIVDISHQVDPQDLIQAAYMIKSSYKYFPEDTVHVIVVDPGVGTSRFVLAFEKSNHIFIAPNNGVLTLLMEDNEISSVIKVENSKYFLEPVSNTFHGRDIFAPVAAHLSAGVKIDQLGQPADPESLVYLEIEKPCLLENGELAGSIVSIDRFGNLITNIDLKLFKKFCLPGTEKKIQVKIGKYQLSGLSNNYQTAIPGEPLAITGSRGYIELAVNTGSAKEYFNAEKGDAVQVFLSD